MQYNNNNGLCENGIFDTTKECIVQVDCIYFHDKWIVKNIAHINIESIISQRIF